MASIPSPPLSEGCFGQQVLFQQTVQMTQVSSNETLTGYCNFALCVEQGKATQAVGWFNMDSRKDSPKTFYQEYYQPGIICQDSRCAMPMLGTTPSASFGPGVTTTCCQDPLGSSIACSPADPVTFKFNTSTKPYTNDYGYMLQLKKNHQMYDRIEATVWAWTPGDKKGDPAFHYRSPPVPLWAWPDFSVRGKELVTEVNYTKDGVSFSDYGQYSALGNINSKFSVRKDSGVITAVSLTSVQLPAITNHTKAVTIKGLQCPGNHCTLTPPCCDTALGCGSQSLSLQFDAGPSGKVSLLVNQGHQSKKGVQLYITIAAPNIADSGFTSFHSGWVTLQGWPDPPVQGYACTGAGGCAGVFAHKGKCAANECPTKS